MQLADHADDPLRADLGIEDLDHALFRKIVERLPELLGLGRITQLDAAEDFGRKIGQAGETDLVGLAQRVAHAQGPVIGDADDVARFRGVGQLAVLREEQDRRMDRDRLAEAARRQLHAAFERARNLPHEGDPVAVIGVHIGLDLEDEAGDFIALRPDRILACGLWTRRRREFRDRLDQFGDAEILQRRSEIDRRQIAVAIGVEIEFGIADLRQLDILRHFLGQFDIGLALALEFLRRALGPRDPAGRKIEHALEFAAHPHRIGLGAHIERQHIRDLVEQFEDRTPLAIDLVDEGDDRHAA